MDIFWEFNFGDDEMILFWEMILFRELIFAGPKATKCNSPKK